MRQRIAGPVLDAQDRADVDAFLGDLHDLLLPADQLPDQLPDRLPDQLPDQLPG
jgi:hypothetical protein